MQCAVASHSSKSHSKDEKTLANCRTGPVNCRRYFCWMPESTDSITVRRSYLLVSLLAGSGAFCSHVIFSLPRVFLMLFKQSSSRTSDKPKVVILKIVMSGPFMRLKTTGITSSEKSNNKLGLKRSDWLEVLWVAEKRHVVEMVVSSSLGCELEKI